MTTLMRIGGPDFYIEAGQTIISNADVNVAPPPAANRNGRHNSGRATSHTNSKYRQKVPLHKSGYVSPIWRS